MAPPKRPFSSPTWLLCALTLILSLCGVAHSASNLLFDSNNLKSSGGTWQANDYDTDGVTFTVDNSATIRTRTASTAVQQNNTFVNEPVSLAALTPPALVRLHFSFYSYGCVSGGTLPPTGRCSDQLGLQVDFAPPTTGPPYTGELNGNPPTISTTYSTSVMYTADMATATPPRNLLYVTLHDAGSVMDVTQFTVTATYCPAVTVHLVAYPKTYTTSETIGATVAGACVANSHSSAGGALERECDPDGSWGNLIASCVCDSGYRGVANPSGVGDISCEVDPSFSTAPSVMPPSANPSPATPSIGSPVQSSPGSSSTTDGPGTASSLSNNQESTTTCAAPCHGLYQQNLFVTMAVMLGLVHIAVQLFISQ